MIAAPLDAPYYRCPGCAGLLVRTPHVTEIPCRGCGRSYPVVGGIATLLEAGQLSDHQPFLEHFRRVRQAEQWEVEPAAVASLPYPAGPNPHAALWQRRAASYQALLGILYAHGPRLRILDLGAGNCWLAWQLARRGHGVEALDINDDPAHGLGVATRLPPPSGSLRLVRASLERPPFGDCQFDVVVAAASLQYARDLRGTVAEAARVLRPPGLLVLLDTPLYRVAATGAARVGGRVEVVMSSPSPADAGTTGPGYVETAALRSAFRAAGLAYREKAVHGPVRATAGRIRRGLRAAARLPEHATMPIVIGVREC